MKRRQQVTAPPKEDTPLVPISCPDCFGVLRLVHEGTHEYPAFICQIDHRYSCRSLIQAKEEQLERIMWAAHVMSKQMITVYEQTLAHPALMPATDHESIRRRINEVKKQCLAIRTMIEASHAVE